MIYPTPRFRQYGDSGLLVELGDTISLDAHQSVRRFFLALYERQSHGIKEAIPAYRSVLVIYDPLLISVEELTSFLKHIHERSQEHPLPTGRVLDIPVAYGGELGPDLAFVADHAGLMVEEVIRIHSEHEYLVYMIGFSPGFPLLGGLDERLYTPRLETPRGLIPQGSVGIANYQTGVYSLESPGGWRIIGRTPLFLYRPEVDPPVHLEIGDIVRFRPISPEEYDVTLKSIVSNQGPR